MSNFIPVNFDDAIEPTSASSGRYNLQVTEAKVIPVKKTPEKSQFRITVGFQDNPEYQNFSVFLGIPHETDEPKTANFKALNIKRFCELFNVPLDRDGIDTERLPMDMVGATANGEVGLSEPNDDGIVFNNLKLPKLRNNNR